MGEQKSDSALGGTVYVESAGLPDPLFSLSLSFCFVFVVVVVATVRFVSPRLTCSDVVAELSFRSLKFLRRHVS